MTQIATVVLYHGFSLSFGTLQVHAFASHALWNRLGLVWSELVWMPGLLWSETFPSQCVEGPYVYGTLPCLVWKGRHAFSVSSKPVANLCYSYQWNECGGFCKFFSIRVWPWSLVASADDPWLFNLCMALAEGYTLFTLAGQNGLEHSRTLSECSVNASVLFHSVPEPLAQPFQNALSGGVSDCVPGSSQLQSHPLHSPPPFFTLLSRAVEDSWYISSS